MTKRGAETTPHAVSGPSLHAPHKVARRTGGILPRLGDFPTPRPGAPPNRSQNTQRFCGLLYEKLVIFTATERIGLWLHFMG